MGPLHFKKVLSIFKSSYVIFSGAKPGLGLRVTHKLQKESKNEITQFRLLGKQDFLVFLETTLYSKTSQMTASQVTDLAK